MQKSDLLWSLYVSEREFIQHHENQRTSASNILGAIAAGVMVAIGTGALAIEVRIMLSALLIVIGIFGWLFCAKLYILIKLHAERSYEYLQALDQEIPSVEISELKKRASKKNKDEFGRIAEIGLNRIWAWFHLAILISGMIFLAISLAQLGVLFGDS